MKLSTVSALFMVVLAVSFAFTLIVPWTGAANTQVFSISPRRGKVGDQVRLIGLINQTGSAYQVWLGSQLVVEKNATGNNVDASFTVPHITTGNYTVMLKDIVGNQNATTYFYVDTAYYLKVDVPALPKLWQENSSVAVWVNVTGGKANTVYAANVTVKVPAPANETYWTLVTLTNTTGNGEGHNTASIYPMTFLGRPHTNYTGQYAVAWNKTLATATFQLGLTNSTIYHRNQVVDIKAVSYKAAENVTIKIKRGAAVVHSEANVTATANGVIHTNWTIPSNASIGTYTVNITSTSPSPTRKTVPDVQTFSIPGFDVDITTRNLARELVGNVTLRVFENGKSAANATSDSSGQARIKLEIGNYSSEAYFKGVKIGTQSATVTNTTAFDFNCSLTNLKVTVVDKIGTWLPGIDIRFKPANVTLTTDVNGSAVLHSLLTIVTYSVNASRYGLSFNFTTIPNLLVNATAVAWFNVNITCPARTLQVSITDAASQPITNAKVRVQELVGGLFSEGSTPDGKFVLDATFGKYTISVYDADGIKLNGTNIDLFQNKNVSFKCVLYGLSISVKVLDYFGQPMSNMNVTLKREGLAQRSITTTSDGTAIFGGVTGGSVQIAVYVSGQTQPCAATQLDAVQSSVVAMKIDKYTLLAGMLVETSQLAAVALILVIVLAMLAAEVYRRRRTKPHESTN